MHSKLSLTLVVLMAITFSAAADWPNIQTIDSSGERPSVLVDSAGVPHVAYFKDGDNLNYAVWRNDRWETQTILPDELRGANVDICMTQGQDMIIPYASGRVGQRPFRIGVAVREAGTATWELFVPESPSGVSDNVFQVGVACAAQGNTVHIVTNGGLNSSYRLRYWQVLVVNGQLSWVRQQILIDPTDDPQSHCDLSLDPSGGLHVSYFENSNGDLRYATSADGENWTTTRIDGDGTGDAIVGAENKILVQGGSVHIFYSYTVGGNTDLKHAVVPLAKKTAADE